MNDQVNTGSGYPTEEQQWARVIALINGKGGAGKTTLTANLAALFALAGFRVLAADLDPQGNLGSDFGYNALGQSDDGRSLAMALTYGGPIQLLKQVRPNLDVICGGEELETAVLTLMMKQVSEARPRFARAIESLLPQYDLVFLDTPPNIRVLQEQALTAADYALVTTRTDVASMDEGVGRIAKVFASVKEETNPDLALLGGVLFATSFQGDREKANSDGAAKVLAATARHRKARERLEKLLGTPGIVFRSWVRYAEAAADDAREGGQAIHELEVEVAKGSSWSSALKSSGQVRLANSAGTVAEDYQRIAEELKARIARVETDGYVTEEQGAV